MTGKGCGYVQTPLWLLADAKFSMIADVTPQARKGRTYRRRAAKVSENGGWYYRSIVRILSQYCHNTINEGGRDREEGRTLSC